MDLTTKTAPQIARERTRETIKKLFKGPWKASNAKQDAETKNSENGEVSSSEGNNVAVDA